MKAEIILWLHVLTRNILDSVGLTDPNPDRKESLLIEEAKRWINSPDFIYICEMLDLDPDYIKKLHEKTKGQEKSNSKRIYEVFYNRLAKLKGLEDHNLFSE